MYKSFIVTGGAGFIGSYLCKKLIELGNNVLAIDNLSTGCLSNLSTITDVNFQFIKADVSDETFFSDLLKKQDYDCIIHLAATVGVDKVVADPAFTMINNIKCTEAVVKSAFNNNKRVFLASSSEVYGKQSKNLLSEDLNFELYSPHIYRWAYACSKITDEFLAISYAKMGLDVVIGRLFNVIGPRQSSRYGMVLPKFVQNALSNLPISIYGDGLQKRCFCNVEDTAKAIINLCQSSISGAIFNIGNNEEITIKDLAIKIKEKCLSNSELLHINLADLPDGFDEIPKRIPDISKIKKEIGWIPTISLNYSINQVIEYEKSKLINI